MPLFDNSLPVKPIPPSPLNVTKQVIDTASSYSTFQYKNTLITSLDGSPWTGIYYTQFIGKDDVMINSNDVSDPTIKQYLKINNFELRVTSPLSNSVTVGTGTSTVTGTANVYPVITPLAGDIFLAEVEAGITGIFEVTGIERMTQFQASAWSIQYSQIGYVNEDTIRDYDRFVVSELVFDVKLLENGSNPLHTKSEQNRLVQRDLAIAELIEEYYTEFFSIPVNTFILPNDNDIGDIVYDPFLVKFWNMFINTNGFTSYTPPLEYDAATSLYNKPFTTVYDALGKQSKTILKYCVRAMRSLPTVNFDATFQRHTLRITPIDKVIFPYIFEKTVSNTFGNSDIAEAINSIGSDNVIELISAVTSLPKDLVLSTIANVEAKGTSSYIIGADNGIYDKLIKAIIKHGTTVLVKILNSEYYNLLLETIAIYGLSIIFDITDKDGRESYVFSPKFYYGLEGQSNLETQVTKAIKKETVLFSDMFDIIDNKNDLTKIERFYQIPFMIVLLQLAR